MLQTVEMELQTSRPLRSRLTRRDWLVGAVAAGSLAATAKGQDYRIRRADIKLGVASYSFRKFKLDEAISMTKQLGTPYINVKDFHLPFDSSPEAIDAARKALADAGLIVVGIGNVNFQKDDAAAMRAKFEYAKRLGAPLMACAPKPEQLQPLNDLVKSFNIKLAIHNHGPEDPYFPGPQAVLKAVKDLDPRFGWCMDVGHTVRTGADPVKSIRDAGARLLDMHIKDLADMSKKESQVAVGQGKIPIAGIFEELVREGYHGSVNLEYEIEETNPLPGMKESFYYMHGVLAGLQAVQE